MKSLSYIQKNFNIPNVLSIIRIIFIIPFIFAVIDDDYTTAGIILIISGISDFLDGYIARKYNQITQFGKMLDPTADKLTLMAVMVCVGMKFNKIFPFMIILITKEILMLIAGAILLHKKLTPPSAKWYGKLSTIVFYVSVIIIISLKAIWNLDIEILDVTLMALTAFFMIYALIRYFCIFMEIIKTSKFAK